MFVSNLSERNRLIQAFNWNHEFIFFKIFGLTNLRIVLIEDKVTLVKVSNKFVKDDEDLSWEVNELMVKFSIELFQVSSLDNKEIRFI